MAKYGVVINGKLIIHNNRFSLNQVFGSEHKWSELKYIDKSLLKKRKVEKAFYCNQCGDIIVKSLPMRWE